ncbi:acyltransferase family protein [Sandaracinobacteroides saxicola]|uniref:Acyltransferase n=1 Tax=Sandaracinobacteroides saxicola TaxID=2759707 RepID=A0A7G5IGW9_9SPHN|nr:acyltransferase [Sandaracinobacteroides saxicola]QMW22611.1 acyltransferase [Sandaracinobacteroides saxicola]
MSLTGPSHRFEVLDALRGLCALLVCLFHFRVNSPVADWALVRESWLFVDFFFVLSGFVIACTYRQRLADGFGLLRFMGLRFGRVYPLHLFMLGLFVLSEAIGLSGVGASVMERDVFTGHTSLESLGLNILLLHSFHTTGGLTWNEPSWSIATEFWTYGLFAVAVVACGRWLNAALLAAVVACALLLLTLTDHGVNVTWDFGMIRCVYGFSLGVLAWALWPRVAAWRPGATPGTVAELAMVALLLLLVPLLGGNPANILLPPLFMAAVLLFAHEAGAVSRLLRRPLFQWLGLLSFSIYMVHALVQARFDDLLKLIERATGATLLTPMLHAGKMVDYAGATPVQGTLLLFVMLALVVGISYLTYRFVEVPGQLWARRRFGAKARQQA